jgi:predicted RNA-binding Zn ribbon-like protein
VRTKDGYDTRFLARWSGPEQVLVPVAESAAGLLSSGNLALVRKCENPECILFFYDTTKNHGRRWCSMSACGNRAKVAAHYRRTRPPAASD